MTVYYVPDTPDRRRQANTFHVPLAAVGERSFTTAHRTVVAELAFAVSDAFDDGDHADARLLAEALLTALDWQPPTGTAAADQRVVYGPDQRGTHYAISRTDIPDTTTAPRTRARRS